MHNPLNPADLYRWQDEDGRRFAAELQWERERERFALEQIAEQQRKEDDANGTTDRPCTPDA
jgi:hypothetical protein